MRVYGKQLLHPATRTFGCAANMLPSYPAANPQLLKKIGFKGSPDQDASRLLAGIPVDRYSGGDPSLGEKCAAEDLIKTLPPGVAVAALALNHPSVERMGLINASPSFEELFGYHRQELLGKNALRLLCDGRVDPALELQLELVSSSLRPHLSGALPVTLRRKTGELVDSLVMITRLKSSPDVLLMLYVDRMSTPNAEDRLLAQAQLIYYLEGLGFRA